MLHNRLREWRQRAGLTQQQLADRAGIQRQTVGGIESGRYGPGVEVGLRLAAALACDLEDLFQLSGDASPTTAVAVGPIGPAETRVALGEISGRTVARPLVGLGAMRWPVHAAQGITDCTPGSPLRIRRLPGAGRSLFLVGCDPALGLLAAHAERGTVGVEAFWWHGGNGAAAAQLERGEGHAAGVHHAGPVHPPAAPWPLAGFHLARWEMGWIVRRGNPKGIRGAADLARSDVLLANREMGAGARQLLDRLLADAAVDPAGVRGYGSALSGHAAVAQAVALGAADVALGLGAAAAAESLDFLPVATEASTLWVRAAGLEERALAPLLAALSSGAFHTDLAAFGPYDTAETGERIV